MIQTASEIEVDDGADSFLRSILCNLSSSRRGYPSSLDSVQQHMGAYCRR